ncbi:MAG: hypothetical protein R3B67_05995 [Phycisphaerales bacterium]
MIWEAAHALGVLYAGSAMRDGRGDIRCEACAYDLSGWRLNARVVSRECGTVNDDCVFGPFPPVIGFVMRFSKPWVWCFAVGVLFVRHQCLAAAGVVLIELVIFVTAFVWSRRVALREIDMCSSVPAWGANAFFMPVAVWTMVFWVGVSFVLEFVIAVARLGEAEELGRGFADGFGVGW